MRARERTRLRTAERRCWPLLLSPPGLVSDGEIDAVVLLLQRDYHCPKCRQQVQAVADRHDEFAAANAIVASVIPESVDRAQKWQDAYDLPYPLLADPSTQLGDEFDRPARFGAIGQLHDMLGRMSEALVIDATGSAPEVVYAHQGTSPADRSLIDELLQQVQPAPIQPIQTLETRTGRSTAALAEPVVVTITHVSITPILTSR